MTGALILIGSGFAVAVIAAFADALTGFVLHRAKIKADRIRGLDQ